MKIDIKNPLIILAIVAIVILLILASGYKIGKIRLPGGIEIYLTPPAASNPVESINPEETQSITTNYAPIIHEIVERREYKNKELVIHEDIYFDDPNGDASLATYKLISANNINSRAITIKDDKVTSTPDEQKSIAFVTATWECGKFSNYSIGLEARIIDQAGNQSDPKAILFDCK